MGHCHCIYRYMYIYHFSLKHAHSINVGHECMYKTYSCMVGWGLNYTVLPTLYSTNINWKERVEGTLCPASVTHESRG